MAENLRFARGYRQAFARAMPTYIVNEIEPAMQLIDQTLLEERRLTCFDVGANTGLWSGALLQHAGLYIDQLHLFEPLPGNLEKIDKHFRRGL